MNFQEYIIKNQRPIQQEKEHVLSGWKNTIDKQVPDLKDLSKLLLESNSGGKNIRGTLVCLGYRLYAKKKSADIYKIAAAYEILHTSLLIHDDVMDKSPLRRGKQTVYQQLGGSHYGISQAICLGDIGFFLATKMISETTFSSAIKSELISQFSQIVLDTIAGQMFDIKSSSKLSKITENGVVKIAELKTAQYTITGPLVLGALLGGIDKKKRKQLFLFGKKLGIAFQMKDDLFGVFGDKKKIGKSATSDIEEGKNTLLIVYALANASPAQKVMLEKYYGKGKITSKEHVLIKSVFKETGAFDYTEKRIQQYAKEASALGSQLTADSTLRSLIIDFIRYLIHREK